VTSVALQATVYEIQTVLAVQPGDDLILGGSKAPAPPTTLGSLTVSYPAHPSAADYTVVGTCDSVFAGPPFPSFPPSTSVVMLIRSSCALDPMELSVIAHDASGNPIGVLTQTVEPFVLNGSTTLTDSYQPPLNVTASYTNVNPVITTLWMTRGISGYFDQGSIAGPVSPPTATQVLTLTDVASNRRALVSTEVSNASHVRQIVSQWISGSAASYWLDLNATLLPWLGMPTFDGASGKIFVPTGTTGTAATPDAVSLTVSYRRTDPATGVMTTFRWTLFSPVIADVTLPNLPLEVGNVMPTAADAVKVSALVVESDNVASYDAIRNDLNGAFSQYTSLWPPGTMRRLEFASDPPLGP
jgi:hypothetical protein